MAELVFYDPVVTYAGITLSGNVRKITLNYEAEMKEFTAGGDDTRVMKGGLKNWSAELELNQDYDDDAIDETMFAKVGTTGAFSFMPASGGVSANNPNYNGQGTLQNWPPIDAAVGDEATVSCTIVSAGTLTRAVA